MKKIILFLGFVAISLASCSSDSDSSDGGSGGVLVKKIVYTSITDEYSETVDYTYNGNKLVKGVYDYGAEEIYTYSGNLITKIELFEDGEVTYSETFTYDGSGRLLTYLAEEGPFTESETFTYNANGTVTCSGSSGLSTYTFENNELKQIARTTGEIYEYTYDGKNSPFRNVTGYDKIAHVAHGDHEFFGRNQNISTIQETTGDVAYMTNTMTYNANNYPLTVNSTAIFEGDGTYNATMQYTY